MAGRARISVATLLLALPQLIHCSTADNCVAEATEGDDVGLLALPQREPDATHIAAALQVVEEEMEKQGASPTPVSCDDYAKVVIFDIDNTLTVGQKHDENACPVLPGISAPTWPTDDEGSGTTQAVMDTIQAARDSGYKLAVASAESYDQQYNRKQKAFLESLFGQDNILGTPAEQSAYNEFSPGKTTNPVEPFENETIDESDGGALGMKEALITNIMQYYGVPKPCWRHSVHFDDQIENNAAAHALGLRTFQSSPECGGFYCQWGCAIPNGTAAMLTEMARKLQAQVGS